MSREMIGLAETLQGNGMAGSWPRRLRFGPTHSQSFDRLSLGFMTFRFVFTGCFGRCVVCMDAGVGLVFWFPGSPFGPFKEIGFEPKTIFLGNFNHPKLGTMILIVGLTSS